MAVKVPSMLGSMSPTFQKAWYKRNKIPLPAHLQRPSQSDKVDTTRTKSMQAKSLKAYGATKGTRMGADDGSGETIRDTIKPLTRDQHSKVQAAARAAKAAEKAAAPKRAPIKSKEDRLNFLKKAFKKAKSPERQARFDVPTLETDHEDLRHDHDLMHQVGVKRSYNEEVESVDEAQKKLKPSYWRAEWRLGTQTEVDKNNKKIYDRLAKTDPAKAKAFHDNLMKMRKEENESKKQPSNYPGQRLQRDYLDRFRTKPQEDWKTKQDREYALATGDKAGRWAHGGKYEEVEMNEVSKAEAEKILGGPVKEKPVNAPKGKLPLGFRRARNLARQAMKAGKSVTESTTEVSEVNEMSYGKILAKSALIKYVAEAASDNAREYDYEGDMAKSQLKSIITNAQRLHDSLQDDTNLPEWVQLKITLAEDYVVTAANYMEGELDESVEIDEAHMTDAQMKKREKYVKSMKPVSDWEKRYPGRGEQVMYATATKMAMKEEVEQIDEDHADAYDKHMTAHYNAAEKGDWDTAETHAVRAEKAAARHFKATGKKIYDPGYTGSSKHVTQVKEEVEQIDEDHEDEYAKHMEKHVNAAEEGDWDKAEMHAQKAEKAAARHFKATGKKVYDPGYTGSSKHVTQVKEEVEQIDEAIRGYIQSRPGNEDGTAIRRPADQAERDQLAKNLAANRKYNVGKKIGRASGNVRSNAAGMTPSQKISTALRSPDASKELGPKKFPYMPKNAKITPFLSKEEVEQVAEAEGKVAVTPKEKALAAHHGDKKQITYGDVIKARIKSAAAKAMNKGK